VVVLFTSEKMIKTVAKRLKINQEQTEHLIRYYTANEKLVRVDGEKPIELVTEAILSKIRST
jgi:adenylate kinase